MSRLYLNIRPNDIQSLIKHFVKKTGVECRHSSKDKADYLDEHILSSRLTPPVAIGAQLDILLRVMCRWAVINYPWTSDVGEIFDIIKEKLSSKNSFVCSAEDLEKVLSIQYDQTSKRSRGSSYVIYEDLKRHVQSVWENIYVPIFQELQNPSTKWLTMFIYPTAYLTQQCPLLFEEQFKSFTEEIEFCLAVKKEQWNSRAKTHLDKGLLQYLVESMKGKSFDEGIRFIVNRSNLWRVIGVFLSFYFKIFPTLVNTANTVLLCYFLTYQCFYGNVMDYRMPSDIRHDMADLCSSYQEHYDSFVRAELKLLIENEDLVKECGIYFGIYEPPVEENEVTNKNNKRRGLIPDEDDEVVVTEPQEETADFKRLV